jgi:hypothetical protein
MAEPARESVQRFQTERVAAAVADALRDGLRRTDTLHRGDPPQRSDH